MCLCARRAERRLRPELPHVFLVAEGFCDARRGNYGADELYNDPAAAAPFLFAPAASMGLAPTDDVDAIALSRSPGLVGGLAPVAIPGLNKTIVGMTYVPFDPATEFKTIHRFDPKFANAMSDLMVFSLDRLSPALAFLDPILGRQLSPADLFLTDFDMTVGALVVLTGARRRGRV